MRTFNLLNTQAILYNCKFLLGGVNDILIYENIIIHVVFVNLFLYVCGCVA